MNTERGGQDEGNGKGGDAAPRLIVGIGASAGGLEACKRFLAEMPAESGMAFVIVMHLDPTHESHIAEIFKTTTAMPVIQIVDKQIIEPNHVYVIAPDSSLEIRQGVLNSKKQNDPLGKRKPIDALFASLAEDKKERAVAIVLSGAGNNGSAGIQAVSEAGGLCIAQDPETADYDSMPKNAIDTGVVDHVLPPEQMPSVLLAYAEHPHTPASGPAKAHGVEMPPAAFDAILELLGKKHRIDFRVYKTGTLKRRTERRMALRQFTGWQAYLEHLQGAPDELEALYGDLLIGVTHFFRDREVWEDLEKNIIPNVLAKRTEDGPVRIWVPGCATGEEAYSFAMLVLDQLERENRGAKLQVYATDVNADAVAFARRGLYPAAIADDVPPHLRRFLQQRGDDVQIKQDVRDSVTFAVHNLLTDAPFSKLDIVSCRNLLIYLEPHAQDRILELFHFALQPGGVLVLGSSETTGRQTDLFEPLSKPHRIFKSSAMTRKARYPAPDWFTARTPLRGMPALQAAPHQGPRAARLVEQLVLSRFTSACVAINQNLDILYFFGPTHDYLAQPTGEVRMDVLSWARSGLYPKLRGALKAAIERRERVTISDIRVEREGRAHRVECTIEPVPALPGAEGLFLVGFRDLPEAAAAEAAEAAMASATPEQPVITQLEGELKEVRQELQATVEQLETTNEEYRASHEELLSLNEELQSSNEELETSKEELQSLNEEMVTINRQLEERNTELRTANADLNNFFVSTPVPIIFLDRDLRVRRFTPAATEVMRLVPSDVGSLEHVKERVHDERLLTDARKVLENLSPITTEVATDDGRSYVRRVLPYRTDDDRIDGVHVSFLEVTAQKAAAAEIDESRIYAEAIVETVARPLVVLDANLRVVSANKSFFETFQVSRVETLNHKIYSLGNRQWDIPALRDLLENLLPKAQEISDFAVEHVFDRIGRRVMRLNARLMRRSARPTLILLAIDDLTERTKIEELVKQNVAALAEEHRRKDEFLAMLGHELRNPLSALMTGLEVLGRVPEARANELRAMMIRQAHRLSAMLDQLLDISRVISGKVALSKQRMDVVESIRAAAETVQPLLEVHRHQLTLALSPRKSAFVMGDPMRLVQVVENLLGNAIKYTNPGGKIGVAVEADEDTVRIVVRDTGIGIAAEFLPHVFEVFTQSPRTLDRAAGGLGLGLPLVQRLVTMHGGRVEASSPGLGQGSEFVVTLPRLEERRSKPRDSEPARTAKGNHRLYRILVVDDEKDTARTLAEVLEANGHRTVAVHDGPAALTALETFEPDVVLLDLGLPEMDGYEVAKRIRAQGRLGGAFLIAVTGYQSDTARLRQAGFDRHLMKPPDLRKLDAMLAEWGGGGNEG
jgi:two-component system, chemotaxis family, CheB/CheR fusion protein